MDYIELIGRLSGPELYNIAVTRKIQCAYLDSGADLDGNTTVLLKTILPQLTDAENIRSALARLSPEDSRALKAILNTGKCSREEAQYFQNFAFFAVDDSMNAYFPEVLKEIMAEHGPGFEKVDERELVSGHLAYAAYIALANGILMKKTRCLHDLAPGKRMLEYVSEKLNRSISKKAFDVLYDFMLASKILIPGTEDTRLTIPEQLPGRDFFYTNLFKYMAANLSGNLLAELNAAAKASGGRALMEKSRFQAGKSAWELLQLCDFIKATDREHFVFTNISIRFMDTKKVSFPDAFREDFFVLPGFRILAEQNVSDTVLNTLTRVALLESFDQVFHFVFNSCSLIQARKQALTEKDLISFVEKHSARCPQDLKLMIRDTFERFGEVKILSGFPVLLCRTENLKKRLESLDEVSRYIFYEDERIIALHGSKKPLELKRLLVEKGLIPELHISRDFLPLHRADMADITEFLKELAFRFAAEENDDYSRLIDLFNRLQIAPGPEIRPDRVEPRFTEAENSMLPLEREGDIPLEDRVEILQFAIARHYRVKVLYKQKGGDVMEERIITPKFFDGDFLVAFCESRNADRRFNLYRLKLAGIIVEG
ncbi:MAG: hypothetical protein GXO69_01020 [Acidobacteria bacterium]|nr:hypothetical protein [Acidobacteriota bacterium]